MLKSPRIFSITAFLAFVLVVLPSVARAVTVSGTVTDPAGNAWANSNYVFTFLPPPGGPPLGTGESTTTVTGVLNSSGAFSGVVLGNNDSLGGFWQCNITAPTGQTFGVVFRITASSSSLSTVISAASPLLGLVAQTFTTAAGSITLSSATPPTTRDLVGSATLSYAGSVTIGTSGSVVGVRGLVTVNAATTVGSGFTYGVQGKLVLPGTLNNGSGFNAGVFGQLDESAMTAHTSGYLAPIMGDFGATSTVTSDANANMITVLNTTQCTIHAVETAIVKASYWQDIQEINASNFLASSSSSVTNVGTKGWIKIIITPNGGSAVTRYIALGDGVT